MENLNIEQTNYTPKIDFDVANQVFSIQGKSYPENTFEFYKPVNEWLKEYFETAHENKTTINLELTYLNSSSLKAYFDIFDICEEGLENDNQLEINWIYEEDDDIIEETGEDFVEDFETLEINLVAK